VEYLGSLFGGLRRGELTALEWSHILFDSNEIRVDNNIIGTKDG